VLRLRFYRHVGDIERVKAVERRVVEIQILYEQIAGIFDVDQPWSSFGILDVVVQPPPALSVSIDFGFVLAGREGHVVQALEMETLGRILLNCT